MTKKKLMTIIGENIRRERMARNISIEGLAEMLELATGSIGLIERGQRGAALLTLHKVADAFGITIESLFYCDESSCLFPEEDKESLDIRFAKRKRIEHLILDLDDGELDFVIAFIKDMRILNRRRRVRHIHIDEDDVFEDEDD